VNYVADSSEIGAFVHLADENSRPAPETGPGDDIYQSTGDSWMTSFWSYAGWPAATVPSFDGPDGLPYGLQIIAPRDRDEQLLGYARVLGAAIRPVVRMAPDT